MTTATHSARPLIEGWNQPRPSWHKWPSDDSPASDGETHPCRCCGREIATGWKAEHAGDVKQPYLCGTCWVAGSGLGL